MDKKLIFVITPIGEKGSEKYKKYDAIFKTMIKPAIDSVDSSFRILRADHISQPGSFIKDILEHIQNAYIVIANLTDLNPNVFYELGVRHALSKRTIMITEDINSLPSDLKEYRAISYYPDITTIEEFKDNLAKTITEILNNPDKSDNPVQDRLPSIIESKEEQYLKEIEILNRKLTSKTTQKKNAVITNEDTPRKRTERIIGLMNVKEPGFLEHNPTWTVGSGDKEKKFSVPKPEDGFDYYYILTKNNYLDYILVINVHNYEFKLSSDLADIRVMLSKFQDSGSMTFKFVIVCNEDLSDKYAYVESFFKNALIQSKANKDKFSYEIWDLNKMQEIEIAFGIRM